MTSILHWLVSPKRYKKLGLKEVEIFLKNSSCFKFISVCGIDARLVTGSEKLSLELYIASSQLLFISLSWKMLFHLVNYHWKLCHLFCCPKIEINNRLCCKLSYKGIYANSHTWFLGQISPYAVCLYLGGVTLSGQIWVTRCIVAWHYSSYTMML